MHLTPGSLRLQTMWQKRITRIVSMLLVTACAPAPKSTPEPLPPPLPVPPPSPVTIPVPLPVLAEDSANYVIRTVVLTTQDSAATTVRRDSLLATERVRAQLVPRREATFSLKVHSDSGYRISTDRMPPPETNRSDFSPVELEVELHQAQFAMRFNTDTLAACSAFPSLVSPLSAAIFARYLAPDQMMVAQRDTISFSACDAGVSRRYKVVIQSTRSSQDPFKSKIQGTFHTDSSRALPMRVSGNVAGEATVIPGIGERSLPEVVRVHLAIELTAIAEVSGMRRTQSYRQNIETRFQREKR